MLSGKQIPDEIINEAIQGIDEQDYREILIDELQKKRRQIKDANPYTARNKLARFGQQRGFESGLIFQVLDEMKKA
jgi:regulatory protein